MSPTSSSAADLQAGYLDLLISSPIATDPYKLLDDYLHDLVLPKRDEATRFQLSVLSGIFGLLTLLAISSLLIRWKKGIFWIARKGSTGLWKPHFSISWTLPAVVFLVLLQPTIAFERQIFERRGRDDFMFWLSLPWLALAYSGLIATWAILASHAQHLQSRGKWSHRYSTPLINSFGIVSSIGYTLLLVPPAVIAGRRYRELLGQLENVSTLLNEASRRWETTSSQSPIPNFDSDVTIGLDELSGIASDYFDSMRTLFGVFAASSFLFAIISATIAYPYLTFLRREMKSVERGLNNSYDTSSEVIVIDTRITASRRKLRRIWNTIFSTVLINLIVATILSVNSLIVAINPSKLALKHRLEIALLVPLYAVASFGIVTTGLLVRRAVQAAPSDDKILEKARQLFSTPPTTRRNYRQRDFERDQRLSKEDRIEEEEGLPISEETTRVDSNETFVIQRGDKLRTVPPVRKDIEVNSRRSSWFGGGGGTPGGSRRSSMTIANVPTSSKVIVDIDVQVVVEEERTSDSLA